jgi:hypothetical protein
MRGLLPGSVAAAEAVEGAAVMDLASVMAGRTIDEWYFLKAGA